MAIAFMCDKCRKTFENRRDLRRVVSAEITSTNKLMNKYDMSIDLCNNCCSELFDFVNKESEEK